MDDVALGFVVRALRVRRGWRQTDLTRQAMVSASLIGLLERGHADRLSVHSVRSICSSLRVRLAWDVGYRRAELAQLRDARHAALAERVTRVLERRGWLVAVEASFNHFGDRGRIELLAFEPRTRTLLLVELKTVLVDLQDLLGSLSVKERVARKVAAELGWSAAAVVPATSSPPPARTGGAFSSMTACWRGLRCAVVPRALGFAAPAASRLGCW